MKNILQNKINFRLKPNSATWVIMFLFTFGTFLANANTDASDNHEIQSHFTLLSKITEYLDSNLVKAHWPDPFYYDAKGKPFISDEKRKQILNESNNIALTLLAPAADKVSMARYLVLGEGGSSVRGFTSLANIVRFFKSAQFKTSFQVIGASSKTIYGYWNAMTKDWQFGLSSDKVISQIDTLYGAADPLVPVKNILVDFETRLPRTKPVDYLNTN
jgi:hypothetical protein